MPWVAIAAGFVSVPMDFWMSLLFLRMFCCSCYQVCCCKFILFCCFCLFWYPGVVSVRNECCCCWFWYQEL
jgi:hypothetical protein